MTMPKMEVSMPRHSKVIQPEQTDGHRQYDRVSSNRTGKKKIEK